MAHTSLLPTSAFIGFEHILAELNNLSKATVNYPPLNVVRLSDSVQIIELAVAGFAKEDLTIELLNNILTIKGDHKEDLSSDKYSYKGISTKKFSRSFRLSEVMEVERADLSEGLLSITLNVKKPEEKQPVLIEIHKR